MSLLEIAISKIKIGEQLINLDTLMHSMSENFAIALQELYPDNYVICLCISKTNGYEILEHAFCKEITSDISYYVDVRGKHNDMNLFLEELIIRNPFKVVEVSPKELEKSLTNLRITRNDYFINQSKYVIHQDILRYIPNL